MPQVYGPKYSTTYVASKILAIAKSQANPPVTTAPDFTPFKESLAKLNQMAAQMSKQMDAAFLGIKPALDNLNKTVASYVQEAQSGSNNTMPATSLYDNESLFEPVSCPACQDTTGYCEALKDIIIHLNDAHKWKREEIADWLDTLPNQPVFYPDVRTDDEKIEDAQKKKVQHAGYKITANSITASKISDYIPMPPATQSGPIKYYESAAVPPGKVILQTGGMQTHVYVNGKLQGQGQPYEDGDGNSGFAWEGPIPF